MTGDYITNYGVAPTCNHEAIIKALEKRLSEQAERVKVLEGVLRVFIAYDESEDDGIGMLFEYDAAIEAARATLASKEG